jgi:hypothetical protein
VRQLAILPLILITLVGCESDFQRCMTTEFGRLVEGRKYLVEQDIAQLKQRQREWLDHYRELEPLLLEVTKDFDQNVQEKIKIFAVDYEKPQTKKMFDCGALRKKQCEDSYNEYLHFFNIKKDKALETLGRLESLRIMQSQLAKLGDYQIVEEAKIDLQVFRSESISIASKHSHAAALLASAKGLDPKPEVGTLIGLGIQDAKRKVDAMENDILLKMDAEQICNRNGIYK